MTPTQRTCRRRNRCGGRITERRHSSSKNRNLETTHYARQPGGAAPKGITDLTTYPTSEEKGLQTLGGEETGREPAERGDWRWKSGGRGGAGSLSGKRWKSGDEERARRGKIGGRGGAGPGASDGQTEERLGHSCLWWDALEERHGYARWQSLVEDKDLGLAEIVRQEMNLPVINGPFVGVGNQASDCANTEYSANESSEAPISNQSNPDYNMLNQFREVQRRIVDFIRKRYHLLDKAMNAELLRERHVRTRDCDHVHGGWRGKSWRREEDPFLEPLGAMVRRRKQPSISRGEVTVLRYRGVDALAASIGAGRVSVSVRDT
ncbi:CHD3-type chromatin-remodeling factor PICKLE [Platanthera zijinensis]|uniref:CHD3-type chromatin-remodeling factor PICKLE n=1 Tax=Platanthera zijinensis TaxID=2320716 RepID=A0AAP0B1B9_9ASPA